MTTTIELPKEPRCTRMKDALADVEQKLIELDDMCRKGMVNRQQQLAIRSRINQWFLDYARQVL